MASNRPTGVSWESYIDRAIRLAQEEGAFEKLPGTGKPINDLDVNYDENWWLRQYVKREQLFEPLHESQRFKAALPEELERLWRMEYEADVRVRVAELNAKIRKLNATGIEGPPLNLGEMKVEEVVDRWRELRQSGTPPP